MLAPAWRRWRPRCANLRCACVAMNENAGDPPASIVNTLGHALPLKGRFASGNETTTLGECANEYLGGQKKPFRRVDRQKDDLAGKLVRRAEVSGDLDMEFAAWCCRSRRRKESPNKDAASNHPEPAAPSRRWWCTTVSCWSWCRRSR